MRENSATPIDYFRDTTENAPTSHVADADRLADHQDRRPPVVCAPWCTDPGHQRETYRHDVTCWGPDHPVVLHLENGAPAAHLDKSQALALDPPRINPMAYQRWHHLPIVYLHIYRPHRNPHLDLDYNLKLTVLEATELVGALLTVIDEIGGNR